MRDRTALMRFLQPHLLDVLRAFRARLDPRSPGRTLGTAGPGPFCDPEHAASEQASRAGHAGMSLSCSPTVSQRTGGRLPPRG